MRGVIDLPTELFSTDSWVSVACPVTGHVPLKVPGQKSMPQPLHL